MFILYICNGTLKIDNLFLLVDYYFDGCVYVPFGP